MQYSSVVSAVFLSRPNRFIAHVLLDGEEKVCHVKNTGRCRELLVGGATVYLQDWGEEHPGRKTRYDLIAVKKGSLLVNMDAQAPNKVFQQWAQGGAFRGDLALLRPETTWGNSRFDFYWRKGEQQGFVEVKGVTLEFDGHCYFPDAPTLRGVKHMEELILAHEKGYEATICFVVQMAGMRCFSPADDLHPAFGATLRRAHSCGVEVLTLECRVQPEELSITGPIPICL